MAAEKAIVLLPAFQRSHELAETTRLEAIFGLGKYQEVLDELEAQPDLTGSQLPQIRRLRLQSRACKELGKYQEAYEALLKCNGLETQRLKKMAQEQAIFMTSMFDDRDRENQVAILEEQQRALLTQADLARNLVEKQTLSAKHASEIRNMTLLFSGLLLAFSIFAVFSFFRRKSARIIQTRERELNDLLNGRLKAQEIELRKEIAARRELEIAMDRQRRFEAIGKLTGGVAHDFNNLLTVVINSNELISMHYPKAPTEVTDLLRASTKSSRIGC